MRHGAFHDAWRSGTLGGTIVRAVALCALAALPLAAGIARAAPPAEPDEDTVVDRAYQIELRRNRVEVDPALVERVPVSGRDALTLESKLRREFGDEWSIAETRRGSFVATRIEPGTAS